MEPTVRGTTILIDPADLMLRQGGMDLDSPAFAPVQLPTPLPTLYLLLILDVQRADAGTTHAFKVGLVDDQNQAVVDAAGDPIVIADTLTLTPSSMRRGFERWRRAIEFPGGLALEEGRVYRFQMQVDGTQLIDPWMSTFYVAR